MKVEGCVNSYVSEMKFPVAQEEGFFFELDTCSSGSLLDLPVEKSFGRAEL